MFEYGDEVQLTDDALSYYQDADPSLWNLGGFSLTVIGVDEDSPQTVDVETDDGECFTFYEFELEFA